MSLKGTAQTKQNRRWLFRANEAFGKSALTVLGILVLSSALTVGCGRNATQEKGTNTQAMDGQYPAAIRGERSGIFSIVLLRLRPIVIR